MMSSMHHSYHPITKQPHTDLTIPGHLLTLLREKRNMRSKRSPITGTLVGLEPYNTSSNGKDILKQITLGNQLTRSMLHTSLKPITDNTLLRIKGVKLSTRKVSAFSPAFYHVRWWPIHQCKQQIAHVDQTPFSNQRRMSRNPA